MLPSPIAPLPRNQKDLISRGSALLYVVLGAGSFQLGWEVRELNAAVLIYAFSLIALSKAGTMRACFRCGFLLGLFVFAPQLFWFTTIFGPAAVCLWAVLALFTGLFASLLKTWRKQFETKLLWLAAPILWCGLEYFRSELYFLRFSWISPGYAILGHPGVLPVGMLGIYGTGFALFALAGGLERLSPKARWGGLGTALLLIGVFANIGGVTNGVPDRNLNVAGVQLEFPASLEVPARLDRVLAKFPETELFVLSEYSFDGPIPPRVRAWCKKNHRYLIAGGKDDIPGGPYYNTAFVIGPDGEVVFKQAKSVPIQFFKDGLPASSRRIWDSPWGRMGICVCYDLSYRRIVDDFIEAGAQLLVVPFMDLAAWGSQQHQLHERVSPVRALEYGIPIFRVGSSGISQLIDSSGQVLARAGFPGEGEMISGKLQIGRSGRLPLDHWIAPLCTALTGLWLFWSLAAFLRRKPR